MSQPQYTPVSPYPQPGEVLDGKYRVEQLLGEGGMGAVAKATHMLRRAPVALKFMSPAVLALQGAVERFVNEGVAASQIDSDHVVKVFDVGRMPTGAPYLVMEFLDGCDLSQLLARVGGRLDVQRTVHFALQILRALQTAHASGIIHRDMKPSNCFVIDKDGEADFVKLVDFGISKVRSDDASGRQANLTRTNSALGTPLYMSPEQARSPRDVDTRADLYSTGAIMYELLSGRTPYTAESGEYTEILFKIFTTDPEPIQSMRPDLDPGLAAVIHRALARDPNQRYSSASEMAEALVAYADDRSGNVIMRLRGGRGRSLVPPTAQRPGVSMPGAGMSQPGAAAQPRPPTGPGAAFVVPANTFPNPVEAMRAPPVPTHVGVTRETPGAPSPGKGGRIAIVALLAGMLLIGGAAAIVVMRHPASGAGVRATQDPATTVTTAPPTPNDTAAGTPSSQLAPLPSVTAGPSVTTSASTAAPIATAVPSNKPRPQPGGSLVGVQPHF
jgi:eukaryotic-like serine/threonine-protein kinase